MGAADAIEDRRYLLEAFSNNGELDVVANTEDHQCILMGRTGTGKTALLEMLAETQERVIRISPDNLALSYLSNNEILKFFTDIGVNMDLFYRLLWRHIFTVEIIRKHYNIVNEETTSSFVQRMMDILRINKAKKDALQYIVEWGRSFWEETDYRIKEVTRKLENDLRGSVGVDIKLGLSGGKDDTGAIALKRENGSKVSEEEKAEIA